MKEERGMRKIISPGCGSITRDDDDGYSDDDDDNDDVVAVRLLSFPPSSAFRSSSTGERASEHESATCNLVVYNFMSNSWHYVRPLSVSCDV